jgi:hypothetical protein
LLAEATGNPQIQNLEGRGGRAWKRGTALGDPEVRE